MSEARLKVAVYGSWRQKHPTTLAGTFDQFQAACRQLGVAIAAGQFDLVVASDGHHTADRWVVDGFLQEGNANARTLFIAQEDQGFAFQHDTMPPYVKKYFLPSTGPGVDSLLSGVIVADVVLFVAGASGTTTAWKYATLQKKPTIPIGAFGGAARRALESALVTAAEAQKSLLTDMAQPWNDAVRNAVAGQLHEVAIALRQTRRSTDVAIVAALNQGELQYLFKAAGDAHGNERGLWPSFDIPGDPTRYYTNYIRSMKGHEISVVSACQNTMGMAAAAALTAKMIYTFRPRLVVMVGIAAGANSKEQSYGDILAADRTFDYAAGKAVANADGSVTFRPESLTADVDSKLVQLLQGWTSRTVELSAIKAGYIADPHPELALRLHVGPLGTGAMVVEDPQIIAQAQGRFRKMIGLEMEAFGVSLACRESVRPAVPFLCIKSICDFAAPNRNRVYFPYAAYTSARFCHVFLAHEWEAIVS